MDNVLTFGKYKGNNVEAIMEIDPNYLLWANENVSFFSLTNEQLQICKKKRKPKSAYYPFDEEDAVYGECEHIGFLDEDYFSESVFDGAFGFCD